MSFDLQKILQDMGPFALAIAAALIVMAVASAAVFFERLWAFEKARSSSLDFGAKARKLLDRGEWWEIETLAKSHSASPLAQLISAGVKTYAAAAARADHHLLPAELARRELDRQMEAIQASLKRGFGVLASVGSIAPFVGLLGTVVGIITAFEGIAREGSGGLGAVSAGIAEALVETALGLVVAIPAVLAFNLLNSRVDKLILALEHAKGEFVDHVESRGLAPKNGQLPRQILESTLGVS